MAISAGDNVDKKCRLPSSLPGSFLYWLNTDSNKRFDASTGFLWMLSPNLIVPINLEVTFSHLFSFIKSVFVSSYALSGNPILF